MAIVRTFAYIAVLALAASQSTLAAPKPLGTGMMTPINTAADALNTGKTLIGGPFLDSAVVVDEFPPYVWKGATAGEAWLNSFGAFSKQIKLTQPHLTLQPVKNFDITSSAAYIVVPRFSAPSSTENRSAKTAYGRSRLSSAHRSGSSPPTLGRSNR